jgi:hypothetical protein
MSRLLTTSAVIIGAIALSPPGVAQAQPYGSCEPERVINSLADAVLRVAPLFVKPRPASALQPVAQVESPQPLQPPGMTREQWKRSLLDGARRYCVQYPDDPICGR